MDAVGDVELVPFSTKPPSTRRAVVRMPFTSEPASGSVTATAVMTSPETMPGIHFAFWASVPALNTWTEAMSVWTSAVMATPL